MAMKSFGSTLMWIGCLIVCVAAGLLSGWIVWKFGLEIIGSAVVLAGAGVGGRIGIPGVLAL
jgi:hypothetical protein